MAKFALILVMLFSSALVNLAHAAPIIGFGSASIDGILGSGEWDAAGFIDLDVNLPGGGTTSARLFVMNDDSTLYLALRFARAFADAGNSLSFEFDSNHDGILGEGDDAFLFNGHEFVDAFRTTAPPCPPGSLCGLRDIDFGGTNDGTGAFSNDGSVSVYELTHALDNADDAHDLSLVAGDTIGFLLDLRMIHDHDFGDTRFPAGGFIQMEIAPQSVPEPSTLALAGAGLLSLAGARHHRRRRKAWMDVTVETRLTPWH